MKNPFKILFIATLAVALVSCANDMEVVHKYIDAELEPDMVGDNVEMLYSDSARLQMKLTTPTVKKYETAKEARDEFPEGLHVWFYEKTGELKAELTANWAIHDAVTDLWEARSNVVLTTADGQKMETEQLFWDPKKGIVYSEKYTKITRANGTVLTGDTFTSKQDFSDWKLGKGKATLVLEDDEETSENTP